MARYDAEPENAADWRTPDEYGLLLGECRLAGEHVLARLPHGHHGPVGPLVDAMRADMTQTNTVLADNPDQCRRTTLAACKRLGTLGPHALAWLTGPDSMPADRKIILWIAYCRYYALAGAWSRHIRDHYLAGPDVPVTRDGFVRFLRNQALWHPGLDNWTGRKRRRVYAALSRTMREAGLLDSAGNVLPPEPSPWLARAVRDNPAVAELLPVRESRLDPWLYASA